MDRPKRQTATATPAKPGGLPLTLGPRRDIPGFGARRPISRRFHRARATAWRAPRPPLPTGRQRWPCSLPTTEAFLFFDHPLIVAHFGRKRHSLNLPVVRQFKSSALRARSGQAWTTPCWSSWNIAGRREGPLQPRRVHRRPQGADHWRPRQEARQYVRSFDKLDRARQKQGRDCRTRRRPHRHPIRSLNAASPTCAARSK